MILVLISPNSSPKSKSSPNESFTFYSVSRQKRLHEESVDPLLSDWIHLRKMVTELLHPAGRGQMVRSCCSGGGNRNT